MMEKILEVKNLVTQMKKEHNYTTIVDHVDLVLHKGESLGIVGESGCGKSMTILSIMRLLGTNGRVQKGEILLNGEDILALSEKEMRKIRGNEMSVIFQDPMTSLNPVMKIGRQISEILEKHKQMTRKESYAVVIDLLNKVGISRPKEIYNEYPHQLSGGMRQRVMIAIAIACTPKLLIADEPTTALDVTIQAQIITLLQEIQKESGMSLLLITHDLGVVAELCDQVMVMYAGQVVEVSDVRTLLRNPHHPYTKGLIKSTPNQLDGNSRLYSIKGNVPSPDQMPKGCRFADRCDFVMKRCYLEEPRLNTIDEKTSYRCWLHQKEMETVMEVHT